MEESAAYRLRELWERSGLSMKEFALRAGYRNASSVQRYLDPAIYKRKRFAPETTEKFVKALAGKGSPAITMEEVLALSGLTDLPGSYPPAPEVEGRLPVRGEVAAGVWREVNEDYGLAEQTVPVGADPRYRGFPQFALRVVGTSMNRVLKEGEFVICVDAIEYGKPPIDGDLVVVHRCRGGLVEATVKRVRSGRGRLELWPESDDPRFQKPLFLGEHGEPGGEDEIVEVVAFVIGRYSQF